MSSTLLAILIMLVSTFTYSIGFVLQHKVRKPRSPAQLRMISLTRAG